MGSTHSVAGGIPLQQSETPIIYTIMRLAAVFVMMAAAAVRAGNVSAACPPKTVPWPDEPCQPLDAATAGATKYLRQNIFQFDKANEASYFDGGIVVPTVKFALTARIEYGWAAKVPRKIFDRAVVPYANVNEARTDWRELFWDTLSTQSWVLALPADASLEDVALAVNTNLWTALGNLTGRETIVFKSEQTPLIYDPLSTVLFGYASCTGISIAYVDALRTLGVPARLVGTPAWHGRPADGNHNWVEVWLGEADGWRFIEGGPAGPGETFSNPCDKWFCNPAHFYANHTGTKVFAAEYAEVGASHYPMAWDLENHGVAGVERSDFYDDVCSAC